MLKKKRRKRKKKRRKWKMDSTFSALFRYVPDTFRDRTALQFPGEAHVLTFAGLPDLVDALGSRLLLSFDIQVGDTVALDVGGCYSPELCIMSLSLIRCGAKSLPLHSAACTREELERYLSHHATKLLLTGPGDGNQTVAQAAANALRVPHVIVSLDLSSCRVDISVPSTPGLLGGPAAAAPSGGAIAEVVDRARVPRFQNCLFLENLTSTIPAGSVAAPVHGASAGWGSPCATTGAAWRPVTGGGRTFGESGGGSVAAPQTEAPHTEAAAVRAEASGLKLKDVLVIAAGAVTAVLKGHAPLFLFYVAFVFFSMRVVFKIKLGQFHGFLKSAGTFLTFCGFATHVITTLPPAFRYTAMAITFAAVAVVLAMFVPLRPLSGTLRDPRPPPSTALDAHLSEQSGSPGGIDAMV